MADVVSDGPRRLERPFYARHTLRVARDLLGKLVVRRRDGAGGVAGEATAGGGEAAAGGAAGLVCGRIVETEAYHGPGDRASHAHRGPTPRNRPMFGPPGHAYVYQIYGSYFCLNVVTVSDAYPAAVLVRAVAPAPPWPFPASDPRAGAGPGKLCALLGIDRRHTGLDLVTSDELWVADDGVRPARGVVAAGPRINVAYAGAHAARPWRVWVAGHPSVSRGAGRRVPEERLWRRTA